MKFNYKMPEPLGFQLAPMLDIVFLLLVFFIVTQTFDETEPDLDVELPSAESAKTNEKAIQEVIVNIRKDGTVTINREIYSMEQLEKKLKSVAQLDPNQVIRLRPDEKTESGIVVRVLDASAKAGLRNVSFSTKPMPEGAK